MFLKVREYCPGPEGQCAVFLLFYPILLLLKLANLPSLVLATSPTTLSIHSFAGGHMVF